MELNINSDGSATPKTPKKLIDAASAIDAALAVTEGLDNKPQAGSLPGPNARLASILELRSAKDVAQDSLDKVSHLISSNLHSLLSSSRGQDVAESLAEMQSGLAELGTLYTLIGADSTQLHEAMYSCSLATSAYHAEDVLDEDDDDDESFVEDDGEDNGGPLPEIYPLYVDDRFYDTPNSAVLLDAKIVAFSVLFTGFHLDSLRVWIRELIATGKTSDLLIIALGFTDEALDFLGSSEVQSRMRVKPAKAELRDFENIVSSQFDIRPVPLIEGLSIEESLNNAASSFGYHSWERDPVISTMPRIAFYRDLEEAQDLEDAEDAD